MKTFIVILAVISSLLLLFTIICGLWIRSQAAVEPSSLTFHLGIALAASASSMLTLFLAVGRLLQTPQ